MADASALPNFKDLAVQRRLIGFAGIIYILWYFIVELVLPGSFNPVLSRIAVSLFCFAAVGLSYTSSYVAKNLRIIGLMCPWLITAHFYYLFYFNNGDFNWVMGCYVTVIAISVFFLSTHSLLAYSALVTVLSLLMLYPHPELLHNIYLPGLVTILVQANLVARLRFGLIQDLRESNVRFQVLFDSAFEGVLVHHKGIIINTNRRLTELYGFTREEFLGRSVTEVVHPEDREKVSAHLQMERPPVYEARGMTKDGRAIEIEIRAKNITYDGKPMRIVTANDISDRRRAEHERVSAMTLAENVRIRDEFISIASHELKTPISALKLQTHLIEKDILHAADPEKFRGVIALFNRQIDRLTELVNTMLDVSRISSGRFTIEPANFDLTALAKEAIATKRLTSPAHHIQLECPERLLLRADKRRLEQVFENLLSNALKYGDGKPISVKIAMEPNAAIVVVADQGLGIAPEFISKIFDRFERAISARNISGLGLGLYITKQIVEAHGGGITASSHLGQGSTFTVRIPLG